MGVVLNSLHSELKPLYPNIICKKNDELPKHESWDLIPRKSKKVMVHRLIFDCLGLEGHSRC